MKIKLRQILIVFCCLVFSRELCAATQYPFKGALNLEEQKLSVLIQNKAEGSVHLIAQKEDVGYQVGVDIKHLTTPKFDLSTHIDVVFRPILQSVTSAEEKTNGIIWQGNVKSQYTLLDYKPVRELEGLIEFQENKIVFKNFIFGRVAGKGYLTYKNTLRVDATFDLEKISMDQFIGFWMNQKTFESTGEVSGQIKASGELSQMYLEGSLYGSNGVIGDLAFNMMYLNIEGYFPFLNLKHSEIYQVDGLSFSVTGPVNISDKKNFKNQIQALKKAALIFDDGKQKEWTIKRNKEDSKNTVELKYFLRKDEQRTGAENNMLGIQQSVDF